MFLRLYAAKEVYHAAAIYFCGTGACSVGRCILLPPRRAAGTDRLRAGGADPGVQDGDAGAAVAGGDDLGAEPRAYGGVSESDGAQSRAATRATGAAPAPP